MSSQPDLDAVPGRNRQQLLDLLLGRRQSGGRTFGEWHADLEEHLLQARMVAPSLAGGAACKSDGRYFSWMAKKDRKPKAKPPGEKWIVYIVRCADDSLYAGIT